MKKKLQVLDGRELLIFHSRVTRRRHKMPLRNVQAKRLGMAWDGNDGYQVLYH